ncbi:hypothetical protein ACFQ0Q_02145 [Streptomyces aureus]
MDPEIFVLRRSDPGDMKAVAGAARNTNTAGQAQSPPALLTPRPAAAPDKNPCASTWIRRGKTPCAPTPRDQGRLENYLVRAASASW